MAIKKFTMLEAIEEQSDAEYTCTFHDAGPSAVQLNSAAILTLTATLRDVSTGTIINDRDAQDVLGANGGSITTPGVFTLRLGILDNVIVTESTTWPAEEHRLTLEATYNRGGALPDGSLNHKVIFFVERLEDVEVVEV